MEKRRELVALLDVPRERRTPAQHSREYGDDAAVDKRRKRKKKRKRKLPKTSSSCCVVRRHPLRGCDDVSPWNTGKLDFLGDDLQCFWL